jgi:tRNA(Ile)-lysidine synthase
LARTAALARDDADALDEMAAKAAAEGLSVGVLAGLAPAVRRRVLRLSAVAAGAVAGRLSAGHLGGIDKLVTDWHGQGPISLPGGLVALRECDRLTFR